MLSVDIHIHVGQRARTQGFEISTRFTAGHGLTILFGQSGAGKSTILQAIAGLVKPRAGHITLGDTPLFDADRKIDVPAHRRGVALVFQSLALFPHMTAEANVAYGMPGKQPRRLREKQALEWMEKMRVQHLRGRLPQTFSGGEAQRIALARALASKPGALLLDEPFSALDEELRHNLSADVAALSTELRVPTVMVTHDRADALTYGTQGVLLRDGATVAVGSVGDVLAARRV